MNESFYNGEAKANGACTHWSPDWLSENGNDPAKTGHIEIYDASQYLKWREQQPSMILHELTHAFHWRDLDRIDSIVQPAFEEAMISGMYEEVPYIMGQKLKHYCTTDYKEYLAEMAEAFFSSKRFRNDYFPFTHWELQEYDPKGFEMVKEVFRLDQDWIRAF